MASGKTQKVRLKSETETQETEMKARTEAQRKPRKAAVEQKTLARAGKSRSRRAATSEAQQTAKPKKYIIRENEILFFSESRGLIEIPSSHIKYREMLDELMSSGFDEARLFFLYDEKSVDPVKETGKALRRKGDGKVCLDDIEIPEALVQKMTEMKRNGFDGNMYQKFWERCLANPSHDSIRMLFDFVSRYHLTIAEDGCFLAYKGITDDFRDCHTGKIDNSVGQTVTMPREKVTFDPNSGCGSGLHVGSYEYAKNFGRVVVLVKVDPADVVSVPKDYSYQKLRCCRYHVESVYGDSEPIETAVVDKDNQPKKVSRERTTLWSEEEVRHLSKLCSGVARPSWKDIGARLKRSPDSCRKKWAYMRK